MTTNTPRAGARLRADLDIALAHASRELGRELEFDEQERLVIEQAAKAADRAEQLAALYAEELKRKPEPRHRTVVALAAEMGLSEKATVDLTARVKLGLGAAKSPRHVHANRVRWDAVKGRKGSA